jgi:YD repeat-containing protein
MAYRGPGQSRRVTAGGTSYQYDATGLSQSNSGSSVYYTTTPDGEVLSERLSTGTYYYLHDGLGSVIGLTNSAGSVVNTYAYDPYGNTTSTTGTTANPFRYIEMRRVQTRAGSLTRLSKDLQNSLADDHGGLAPTFSAL